MAISVEIPVPALGVSANYHRITQITTVYEPDHKVEGSIGTLFVTVVGYPTKEARDEGRGGIDKGEFQIRFGVDVASTLNDGKDETPYEDAERDEQGNLVKDKDGKVQMITKIIPAKPATSIPVISSDEPTRTEIYTTIMALPQFADASEI